MFNNSSLIGETSTHGIAATYTRSTAGIVFGAIVLILLITLTIIGNVVVVRAIYMFKQLRDHHSNWFIANLALADSLMVFVSLLSLVELVTDMESEYKQQRVIGETLCQVQCAMNYCLIVVSMLSLGFISIDRLIHVVYPLHYLDKMSNPVVAFMLLWPWLQGLVIGAVPWIMNWIHYDYDELVCAIDWTHDGAFRYVYVAFVTCFLLPFFTMIICYSVILRKSHIFQQEISKQISKVAAATTLNPSTEETPEPAEPNRSSVTSHRGSTSVFIPAPVTTATNTTAQHKRVIRSLLIVVAVFMISMTPFCVTKVIKVSGTALAGWISTSATFVQLAASAWNPFIYGIFRREFRKAFKQQYGKIFKTCHCSKASEQSIDIEMSRRKKSFVWSTVSRS